MKQAAALKWVVAQTPVGVREGLAGPCFG